MTAEVMDQEAQIVAEDVVKLVEAGATMGGSFTEAFAEMVGRGLTTFGDVQSGLDDDANVMRFVGKVLVKTGDLVLDKYLPLTETESA